ncbi:hypothetical protein LUZ60_015863 [Juncus effusus]|nr:hypothetical protein LUZ60_015863 [Juncus effusus]
MGETGKRFRRNRDHDNNEENRSAHKKRHTETHNDPSRSDNNNNHNNLVLYRILCPATVIGSVIGKGGKVINSIRQQTRAKIKVLDPFLGSDRRVIAISCYTNKDKDKDLNDVDEFNMDYKEPVCQAQDALIRVHEAIVESLQSAKESEERKGSKEELWMLVPSSQASNVIGKGGSIIKRIRASAKAIVKVNPKDPNEPRDSCALNFDNFVYINGESESVKKALFAISTIMYKFPPKEEIHLEASMNEAPPNIIIPSDLPLYPPPGGFYPPPEPGRPVLGNPLSEIPPFPDSSAGIYPPNYVGPARSEEMVVRVLCPKDKIGRVIGKSGGTIKHIRQMSGARIDVEDNLKDMDGSLITVVSTEATDDSKSAAVDAVLLLQEKINDEDKNIVEIKLVVPKRIIGCLIGKGGCIINDIRRNTNTEIRISNNKVDNSKRGNNSADETVEVSGEVASVKDALVQIVLRLREDALRDRDGSVNSFRDMGGNKPPSLLPHVDPVYVGLSTGLGLPSVPSLAYDPLRPLEPDRGLGLYSGGGGSSLYGSGFVPAEEPLYGSRSSYASTAYGGHARPHVEMVIPGNALPKVMGKGGANLDNIRKISGAQVEIVDSQHSHYDRIAQISGNLQQQQSAEDLIRAFILSS